MHPEALNLLRHRLSWSGVRKSRMSLRHLPTMTPSQRHLLLSPSANDGKAARPVRTRALLIGASHSLRMGGQSMAVHLTPAAQASNGTPPCFPQLRRILVPLHRIQLGSPRLLLQIPPMPALRTLPRPRQKVVYPMSRASPTALSPTTHGCYATSRPARASRRSSTRRRSPSSVRHYRTCRTSLSIPWRL